MSWSKEKLAQRRLQLDNEAYEREREWRARIREELKALPPGERRRWMRYLRNMGC